MLSLFTRRQEPGLAQKCSEWFLASRHALLAYARQQADDETDVELLLSEVCRNVTETVCTGRLPLADITPYTLRSLYNRAIALRRKNAHRQLAERRYGEEAARQGDAGHDAGMDRLEDEHIRARRALQSLPEELSTIVTLRVWCEMTFAEISAKLNIPETTVRRRYDKGLKQIKDILNKA